MRHERLAVILLLAFVLSIAPVRMRRKRYAQRRPERQPRRHPTTRYRCSWRTSAQRRPERQPRRHFCSSISKWNIMSAQRRPERQPRRHPQPAHRAHRHVSSRSTKAGASTPATPAHAADLVPQPLRSTKAGASTPATLPSPRSGPACAGTSLNEGRSVNPGDTQSTRADVGRSDSAQRRPERQPRRHTHQNRRGPAPTRTLNEGRSVNPGDTTIPLTHGVGSAVAQRRPERQPRRHAKTAESIARLTNAQRRPERQPRRHSACTGCSYARVKTLNEGRSVNPGDTRIFAANCDGYVRPLNEGRSVNPGDTAKLCKRAISGQTIARPRAREPRRRRVCGHFTRFRTLPRQNGQDQAVETALTAAEHTRFPRITEGSQMSQSTQG